MQIKPQTLQETEFLAENTLVEIIPNFVGDKLQFISGTFGPFKPGKPTSVPLWLALYLRKRNKCSVSQPVWLTLEAVSAKAKEEEANTTDLAEIPSFYYSEIATLLLSGAAEDMKDVNEIRPILEDIHNLRYAKLMSKVKDLDVARPAKTHLGNIASEELAGIRTMYTKALNVVYELTKGKGVN